MSEHNDEIKIGQVRYTTRGYLVLVLDVSTPHQGRCSVVTVFWLALGTAASYPASMIGPWQMLLG